MAHAKKGMEGENADGVVCPETGKRRQLESRAGGGVCREVVVGMTEPATSHLSARKWRLEEKSWDRRMPATD